MTPIVKTLDVPLTPQDAFDLFTKQIGRWWPVDSHSISAGSGTLPQDLTLEPKQGGKIIETDTKGDPHPWGHITHWSEGARVDINWYVGRDVSQATQISVTFTPIDTGTRVDLTHSGFAAHGETARASHDSYDMGWDHVLGQRFLQQCRIVLSHAALDTY